jgi:hypothetical protein
VTAADLAAQVGATPSGDGFTGRCPAHDDQKASLSFRDGETAILFKCHAGCSHAAIREALGLRAEDLRLGNTNGHAPESRIVATYDYTDRRGTLLYQAVRFEPKAFRQRRPDGRGGWTWNLDGVPRVLYRLPELVGHAQVVVVEGEKDADRLWTLDLPATSGAMGAGKWRSEYAAQLHDADAGVAEVVVLEDNDRPGVAHAEAVAASCHAAGLVVRRPRLPGLPPVREKHGEDVSDWLDAGHSADELRRVIEATPRWTPAPEPTHAATSMHFTRLGDLLHEPEETTAWLVEGRLPTSGISLLCGKPKAGKTTAARCLALAVARGAPWLGFRTVAGPVLYLALEEKRAEVRRHFRAMGATDADDVRVFCAPSPEDGLRQLRAAVEAVRPVLIIVDPLLRFVRVRDANDYAVVTAALEPLVTLARETGAHVLAVHHLGKVDRDGGDGIIGSTAFYAAVDTALLLRRSEEYRTLHSRQRYGDDLEEITLTLDPVTRWVSAGPSRRDADEARAATAVLAYLAAQEEPVEEPAVHEAVEGRKVVKQRALRALVAAHRVERTGGGKRGDPYRYQVAPGAPTDSSFLAPIYRWEPENQKRETGLIASIDAPETGSRDSADSAPGPETPEPASGPPAAPPLVVEL